MHEARHVLLILILLLGGIGALAASHDQPLESYTVRLTMGVVLLISAYWLLFQ